MKCYLEIAVVFKGEPWAARENTGMQSKRTKLQEKKHFRAIKILNSNPEEFQRKLVVAVGVSVGSFAAC